MSRAMRTAVSAAAALLLLNPSCVAQEASCVTVDVSGAALSASHDNTINSNEDYHRAFDSDVATKWLVYEGKEEPVWVQAVLEEAVVVTRYGITSANDAPERDPSAWSVSASNDGVYFVTLDEQLGIMWDSREQRQVFSLSNSVAYTYYRFDFHSVRDSVTANSMQINYISLYEGDCDDPCCGVDCGAHGECAEGSCVCDFGYEGSACTDLSINWGTYSGRAISGVSPSVTTTAADLEACQQLCIDGNADASCVGVNYYSSTGSCDVVAGAAALNGWRLATSSGAVASLFVSANLQDTSTPVSKDVAEQVDYTVSWDPVYQQMPRVDMFIGESVTFLWEDVNLRNLPQYSAPNHHDVYLFAGEAQYQRCDFRGAKVVAVAPLSHANTKVTWTSTAEGKYYFGSKYSTDCSVGQLKMIVQVKRRPSP